MGAMLPHGDAQLVQLVDKALADATERSGRGDGGSWLACHPGCTPCCHGVFRISALDAERLRAGLHRLLQENPLRADGVQERALRLASGLRSSFPGDPFTGVLDAEEQGTWDVFSDLPESDGPCPVLDPITGHCTLYGDRPLTCRIFGPPVRNQQGIGVCELCYAGASEAEVLQGEMIFEHQALEDHLDSEMPPGETIIAWALLPGSNEAPEGTT